MGEDIVKTCRYQNADPSVLNEYETVTNNIYYATLIYILPIIITNLAILFVYFKVKQLQTPRNCAIAVLAVADLLMGVVFIPIGFFDNFDEVLFRETLFACFIGGPLRVILYFFTCSMLMILTIDRASAISWPLWYESNMTKKRILWTAAFIITIDILLAGVYQYLLSVYAKPDLNASALTCNIANTPVWFTILLTAVYLVKVGISCGSTLKVVVAAFQSINIDDHIQACVGNPTCKKIKSDAILTSVLMLLFLFFTAPAVIIPFTVRDNSNRCKQQYYLGIGIHFFLVNSCINAFVYAFSDGIFKQSFKFLLTHRPWHWGNVSGLSFYSTKGPATRQSIHDSGSGSHEQCHEDRHSIPTATNISVFNSFS